MSSRFNLDKAISAWRRSLEHNDAFLREDVDELERHVRDRADALGAHGVPPEEAFARAVREIGALGSVETEYRKVYWAKLRRKRKLADEIGSRSAMLKSYVKIAGRHLWSHPGYTFINVFGLAVGLAFCLLISLHLRNEWSFDEIHERGDRIYRIHRVIFEADGSVAETDNYLPEPLGPAMRDEFPEVETFVRLWQSDHLVRSSSDPVEASVLFADPSLFEVFTFPFLRGNPSGALRDPNSVVLTESAARRYFGDEEAVGRTLSIRLEDAYVDFTVTAVARDVPENSSVGFEIVAPLEEFVQTVRPFTGSPGNWEFSAYITYLLLDDRSSGSLSEERLLEFRHRHYPDERLTTAGVPPATYRMQALPDIHLDPSVSAGLRPPSSPRYGHILAAIALAVLFIACVNFMTLAVGRSASRAREIGVRKVVGALRTQLMAQFWLEAVLLSGLAIVFGALLAFLFLPTFNSLTGSHLDLRDAGPGFAVLLAVAALATGLLAGAYPALALSGFRPIDVLKDRLRLGGANLFTRSLIVAQFGVSMFLIACTVVMVRQLEHLDTRHLGFDKEHLVVVPTNQAGDTRVVDRFRNELTGQADVVGISASTASFARGGSRVGFEYRGEPKDVYTFGVESNYVDVMGMRLVAGRSFDPDRALDSSRAVVVNEAFVRDFEMADPVGSVVDGMAGSPETDPIIIGVLQDYNYRSLEGGVAPLALRLGSPNYRYLLVRIVPGDIPATIEAVEAAWRRAAGDIPFQYSFLDDDLDAQYREYARWSRIVAYAGGFAIVIACLGLFGLTTLTVSSRRKEIGIRKVLGASALRVTSMVSKEFALLIGLAFVLSVPAVYFAMRDWLSEFAYRIDLSWVIFLAAGLAAFGVAMGTVGVQAMRAGLADPVKSLRYE